MQCIMLAPTATKPLFFLLLFVSFVCIFTSDMHIPSLLAINAGLHTTETAAQLTVTLFFLGICSAQLFYGPISDRFGRRPTLFLGLSIGIIGSFISYIAPTIEILLAGRYIQGFGAAAGFGLVRTVCADLYKGNRLAQVGSSLWMIIALAPALAPIVGGYVQTYFDWRIQFLIQMVGFCAALIISLFLMRETNRQLNPAATQLAHIRKTMKHLLTHKQFITCVITTGLTLAGTLSYLTVSAYLYQDVLGLNPSQNGWLAVGITFAMLTGNFANAKLLNHFKMYYLMQVGFVLMACSGFFLISCALLGLLSVTLLLLPIVVYVFGSNLVFTNATAFAVADQQSHGGMANSMYSCIQMGTAFLGSTLAAMLPSTDQLPLGLLLTGLSLTSLCLMRYVLQESHFVEEQA